MVNNKKVHIVSISHLKLGGCAVVGPGDDTYGDNNGNDREDHGRTQWQEGAWFA